MFPYLQLVRLPTVFTAMADVLLGYCLTHRFVFDGESWDRPEKFWALLAASCCLYLSGMVFNDVFDLKQDSAERPTRPIPSGRIPRLNAVVLGIVLMGFGLGAAWAAGPISFQVSALLGVAILAYDGILKRTPLGPLAMGTCRALNVMLGASDHSFWKPFFLAPPQTWVAVGMGMYIVGVTWFARTEAKTSSRWQLGMAQVMLNCGLGVLVTLMFRWPTAANLPVVMAMLAVVAFTVNRRAISAIISPSPFNVQLTIKLMLLSYVMVAATMIFWKMSGEPGDLAARHALVTAALVIPAILLARFIPMT